MSQQWLELYNKQKQNISPVCVFNTTQVVSSVESSVWLESTWPLRQTQDPQSSLAPWPDPEN